MIKTVRVDISAGNPEAPIGDFVAFVGSAISFTLTNVPRELGKRVIERVAIEARTHQGVVRSFEGERVGSAWGVTITDNFFTHPCYIKNGIKVTAFGTGNGGEAEAWTLGIGDITILENLVTIQPNDELQELVVVDGAYLENPRKGYFDLAGMRIYDGTRWVEIGGGGAGATVLTMNGGKLYNGTEEITQYSALLSLVRAGGVVLLDTVAGTIAKEALFHPHMADDTAIRFDATGMLGEKVYTRSFAFTPKSGGGITVSRGNLTEVAKKSDVPAVVTPASYMALRGKAADAYETGKALPLFFNSDPSKSVFRNGDNGEPVLQQINYNVRYHFPANVEGDLVLALVNDIPITAQDFNDFYSQFEGSYDTIAEAPTFVNPSPLRIVFVRSESAIYITETTGVWYRAYSDDAIYPTPGFLKLLVIYEKFKATLFTDTAFKTKVEEIIDEHGGTGFKHDEHGYYIEVEQEA